MMFYLAKTPMGTQIMVEDADTPEAKCIGVLDPTYPELLAVGQQIVNTLNRNEAAFDDDDHERVAIISLDQAEALTRALETEGVAHIITVYASDVRTGASWTPTPQVYSAGQFCAKLHWKNAEQQFVEMETTDGPVEY